MTHPGYDELLYLAEILVGDRNGDALNHVLECPSCRRRLQGVLHAPETVELLLGKTADHGLEPPTAGDLAESPLLPPGDDLLDGSLPETADAAPTLKDLAAQIEQAWPRYVLDRPASANPQLVDEALQECRKAAGRDPKGGERLARWTLALLDAVDVSLYGERTVDDLRAQTHALLGDLRRRRSDLEGAEEALARAQDLIAGSLDPRSEVRVWASLGALRRDQGSYPEAARLLHLAAEIYRELGDAAGEARALLQEGRLHTELAESDQALAPLRAASALIDPEVEPRLAAIADHTLAQCLADLGRYPDARRVLEAASRLYPRIEDGEIALEAKRLEGVLAAGTGDLDRARRLLLEVRRAYADDGSPWDVLAAGLDLAAVHVATQDDGRLESLCDELTSAAFPLRLGAKAITALRRLGSAARQKRATVEMVRRAARAVRRRRTAMRVDPSVEP